ncbi:trypsin-1-like isoform X1 [Schistocerca nitens]|uniref:trypsin-1-like isoform X1 n=1 Tax=Schistocerca nitens TaxID=7011 RepID=UPI00211843B8|nr:trypsin-1-like isoform X1 [Schistocerca nitens]
MLKAALALCLLFAVCCAAPSTASRRLLTLEIDDRILGGEVANISKYPWMVSVEYLEAHRCGGTIVSSNWVMTVASCIWGTAPNNFALRVGTSTRGSGGTAYLATQLFWHDDYVPVTSDKDIGFFQTTDSISFDDNVQAIPLATEELEAGTSVTVSGWGSLQPGADYPEQLHAVNTTIIDRSSCNDTYEGLITENMICAGEPEGGKDSCNGDKGGPLVANSTQYGIISWGYGCFYPPYPGVYTNIVSLRS